MATYNVDLQDDQGNSYRTMANPDSKAEFTEATSRENINSGETHRTIFGKLRKFLSDLGAAAYIAIANNCTTTAAGFALDARQGKVLMDKSNQISSDLTALNDSGAIKGLEVHEGDGVYITYTDGADTVSKKLGNTEITFDIFGSGDNPNYLPSTLLQFHRTSFDGFLNAGYKKCKIVFSSFSGAQSTGRLEIRKNGATSTYYSNPGTVEFNIAKGDYIAGYVTDQRTFRFGASVTMSG